MTSQISDSKIKIQQNMKSCTVVVAVPFAMSIMQRYYVKPKAATTVRHKKIHNATSML